MRYVVICFVLYVFNFYMNVINSANILIISIIEGIIIR